MRILTTLSLFLFLLSGCSRSVCHPEHDQIPLFYSSNREVKHTPVTAVLKKAPPLLVMIDAGHGGKDPGASTLTKPVHAEKNLALSTAKLLETYLKQLGMRTQLTRSDDTFLELNERVALAEKAKADLFVSVHYNAAADIKAKGIEVFYYESDKDKQRTVRSKALGNDVLKQVLAHTKAKSRGLKHGNYAVIREAAMPAILVEGGFLTNSEEAERIKSASYLKEVAWGIARGVVDWASNQRGN